MTNNLKAKIETCKTGKQVMKILKANGIRVFRDDTEDMNGWFSIWLDDVTRIYKPYRHKGAPDTFMRVQKWERVRAERNGYSMVVAYPLGISF